MPVQKQAIDINFAQGLDTKSDPKQVAIGNFLELENAVFETGGLLKKRNGFSNLTDLGNTDQTTITTFNGNLVATGSNLQAYNADSDQWYTKGTVQPVDVHTLPVIRSSGAQTKPDIAMASNGSFCSVFLEGGAVCYQVSNSSNGTVLVNKTQIVSSGYLPKIVVLGNYFVITFITLVTATPTLRYIAIPVNNPTVPGTITTLSSQVASVNSGYDICVANNTLCFAWEGSDVGGAIRLNRMSSSFTQGTATVITGYYGAYVSINADSSQATPVLYISYYDNTLTKVYSTVYSYNQSLITAPVEMVSGTVTALTSVADSGVCTLFYQISNIMQQRTITQAGVAGTAAIVNRSLYIASKPFIVNSVVYILGLFSSSYQPTYFLVSSSGKVVAKLAASNAGSTGTLSSANLYNGSIYISYEVKDLLVSVNKDQGAATSAGIYTETGIGLASFNINNTVQSSSEISSSLHLTGGILWQYDGTVPVEQGFLVYPETLSAVASNGAGSLTAQQYYYVACYEWTDAAGNIHRSAPSVPLGVNLIAPDDTITVTIPTLRLTYKSSVRLVLYRWSTAQQLYFQVSSITAPTLNDTSVDSVTFVDTKTDAQILGNTLLYTTGGVLENIAAPASFASTLYKNRLFVVNAENRNEIWYSKIVLAGTPVEMTDLQTIYVAPTTGVQGSTGDIKALSAIDDKLIIFKQNAIYYMTGNGPDATGANNDFSEPTYITSAVGCSEPESIVQMPMGIMFKSTKGIWLLGRDLSTKYIGTAVEAYNGTAITSAVSVPNVNEVRFTNYNNQMLVYNYFYGQWSIFTNAPAISSCIYNDKHTYLTPYGKLRQETDGVYLDGSSPVLLKFTTSWIKLTGLQGFQRAYFFTLLADYVSPHKLAIQLAYDYISAITQTSIITPPNTVTTYGSDPFYGSSSPYGGDLSQEQYRIFLKQQKCQSIRLTVVEQYDSSKGAPAGAGFSMSGINLVVGAKGINQKVAAKQSVG